MKERIKTGAGIGVPCIGEQGLKTDCRVALARRQRLERLKTYCRVVRASGEIQKGVVALRCVAIGIPSVRWWTNRQSSMRSEADES